jgi:hypothetical protein
LCTEDLAGRDAEQNVVTLKGALHTHSTCSDGELTPEQVVEVYLRLGFDFVALTDHDFLMRPGCYDRLPESRNGTLIFQAIELTVFAGGYFHVTKIRGEREELYIFNHPAEYDMTLDQIVDRIETISGMVPVDVVEVTSKGFYTPEYDVEKIPYPKVASDDSHTEFGCGRAWMEVESEKDRDAIIRALKQGKGIMRFK